MYFFCLAMLLFSWDSLFNMLCCAAFDLSLLWHVWQKPLSLVKLASVKSIQLLYLLRIKEIILNILKKSNKNNLKIISIICLVAQWLVHCTITWHSGGWACICTWASLSKLVIRLIFEGGGEVNENEYQACFKKKA